MLDVQAIWIIGQDGTILYDYELFVQGSEEYQSALFGNLITVLQQFAFEIGRKELKVIELSDAKIVVDGDHNSKVYYVLKCSKSMDSEKALHFLHKIRKFLKTKFVKRDFDLRGIGVISDLEDMIQNMLEIGDKSSLEQFLEDL